MKEIYDHFAIVKYATYSLCSSEPYFLARSLAACELLYNAGYKNLFWVQGGLEAAEDEACFPIADFWNFYCSLL